MFFCVIYLLCYNGSVAVFIPRSISRATFGRHSVISENRVVLHAGKFSRILKTKISKKMFFGVIAHCDVSMSRITYEEMEAF